VDQTSEHHHVANLSNKTHTHKHSHYRLLVTDPHTTSWSTTTLMLSKYVSQLFSQQLSPRCTLVHSADTHDTHDMARPPLVSSLTLVDWLLLATALLIVLCNLFVTPADNELTSTSAERIIKIAKHQRMLYSAAMALDAQLTELRATLDHRESGPSRGDNTQRNRLSERYGRVIDDTHHDLLQHLTAAREEVEHSRKAILANA
jgi:hypothetical protein